MKMQRNNKGHVQRVLRPNPAQLWTLTQQGVGILYLKKMDGPRAVALPDGTYMSRADLPPKDTTRWVASRKFAVVKAVASGLISQADACAMYDISDEEFQSWRRAIARYGQKALRTTATQRYRQV